MRWMMVARTVTTSGEEVLRNDTRQPKMGIPTTPSEPDLLARLTGNSVVALFVAQINSVNYSRCCFYPKRKYVVSFALNFFSCIAILF